MCISPGRTLKEKTSYKLESRIKEKGINHYSNIFWNVIIGKGSLLIAKEKSILVLQISIAFLC